MYSGCLMILDEIMKLRTYLNTKSYGLMKS